MKKLLFLSLLILAACSTSQDPEPIKGPTPNVSDNPVVDPPRTPDNGIDPGCHGGEWFESHNLGVITPWTYNEWASFTLKAYVPQPGYGGMGPVEIKYKIRNVSGTTKVKLNFHPLPATGVVWTGNFFPILNPGQSNTVTMTISGCQPIDLDGWFEYNFDMMFQYQGGGTTGSIGGEILSVTGLSCTINPYCIEHKKANHDQGFIWTVQP